MIKAIQRKVQSVTTSVSNENERLLKKYVDAALADGVLTEEEHVDVRIKAGELNIDDADLSCYVSNRVEEQKLVNWARMKELVAGALIGGSLSEDNEALLIEKCACYQLDITEFKLFLNSEISKAASQKSERDLLQNNVDLISDAKAKITEIELARKSRAKLWKKRFSELKQAVKGNSQESIAASTAHSWWKRLPTSDKEQLRQEVGVTKKLIGRYSDEVVKQLYYEANHRQTFVQAEATFTTETKEQYEKETALLQQENETFSHLSSELNNLNGQLKKQYKVEKIVKKIEKNISIDISVQIQIDHKFLAEINNIISNPGTLELVKAIGGGTYGIVSLLTKKGRGK
ncbi:MAG: hypothetical protein WA958_15590 [Tunicatimonas sp.]